MALDEEDLRGKTPYRTVQSLESPGRERTFGTSSTLVLDNRETTFLRRETTEKKWG